MKLSEICIKRPVLSFVLNAILVLCGLMSLSFVNFQFEPTVFKPRLMIVTNYSGASAEVVQKDITQKLTSALSGIENLSYVEASSTQGQSQIKLNFGNISQEKFLTAQSQVLRAIASVSLPQNADTPKIRQRGGDGQLVFIGFSDDSLSNEALSSYLNDTIVKQLSQIPGVGQVDLFSEGLALRIELKPEALATLKLTPQDVIAKLNKFNSNASAGQIFTKDSTYTVNINTSLDNLEKFNNLIIAKKGGRLIYLKQVATIALESVNFANPSISMVDGKPGVVVAVSQTTDANPIAVANKVVDTIKVLQNSLPPGMKASVLLNIADSLKASLYEVIKTIIEAVILVALISLMFLGRVRAALVPIMTIPVCLVSVFVIIWPLGFSINMMTLLALVLAVGLVVDDAIVVLENCYRYMQRGLPAFDAAIAGSREIGFAIIGMTVTLAAVYLPIAFMNDKMAVFFKEFAFTLAAAVLISGFVALSLSPTMCAHMLGSAKPSRYEKWVAGIFDHMAVWYRRVLNFILEVRFWIVILFLLLIVAGFLLYKSIPVTLQPDDTIGVVGVSVHSDGNGTTDNLMDKLEQIKRQAAVNNQIAHSFGFVYSGDGGQIDGVSLNILKPGAISYAQMISKDLNHAINEVKGVSGSSFVIPLSGNSQGFGGGDIGLYLLSMDSFETLYKKASHFSQLLSKLPGISDAEVDTNINSPEFNIDIDYTKSAILGVAPDDIQSMLSILFGGWRLNNDYEVGGESYPIIVQLPKSKLRNFKVLNDLYIKNDKNGWVQLSRFVSIKPVVKIPYLMSYNQMNAMPLSISLAAGFSMGQAIDEIELLAKQAVPGVSLAFKGDARDMIEGGNSMLIIFIAGLLFIYLVLAALFESFIDPFIILLTVPLCVIGGLLGLKIIGGTLNIYTEIGLITLVGLVSKHGILIVQFANELKQKGYALKDAIIAGAATRLRPILMTSATMILGAIPLVLTSGVGEHARQQIGIVIVFGLLLGSLFSLFIVPVAYMLMKSIRIMTRESFSEN
ncbi:MAG: efflux RND transporter permease subunit [Francisellaceae bacterium]